MSLYACGCMCVPPGLTDTLVSSDHKGNNTTLQHYKLFQSFFLKCLEYQLDVLVLLPLRFLFGSAKCRNLTKQVRSMYPTFYNTMI